MVDVAVACGVEVDEPGADRARTAKGRPRHGRSPSRYFAQYEFTSQFEGAERIADKWGITRADTDEFGLRSQQRAAQAWAEGRFDTQIVAVDAPDLDDDGKPTGTTHRVARDEGLRETTLEELADAQAGRPRGRRAHRRHRRRRSPTAPRPCC